ncbi:hypothetical protein CQA66_04755 [Helicobacter aurati]|uniref:Uncharacterized protein n=1 Tax=Helicobacter aurati TaxID=137778 RepID=A0A3D8J4E9_9HELI|nr:uroporphyrinogen-III C-methyltransferase [Helicobacter aurati]RDU72377.1 hypothetical protein CQA66_04755 [Helicobacter aurati]
MSRQHSLQNHILPIALKPKKTLLIGAGSVAKQKYQVLLDSGFEVSIVARRITDDFFLPLQENIKFMSLDLTYSSSETNSYDRYSSDSKDLAINTSISDLSSGKKQTDIYDSLTESTYGGNDIVRNCTDSQSRTCTIKNLATHIAQQFVFLHGFEIVIDASGDRNLGQFLYENKRKYGYLLNVVDVPCLCDFYFGAITRNGNVTVLVSSNGASPLLAQSIRDKIANLLPKALANFSYFLQKTRKKPLNSLQKAQIKAACQRKLGKVFIIGCGPGDFKSLTLRAFETLSLLDVALIDNLVGEGIREYLASHNVQCINVGKQKGKQSCKQEDIHALMLQFAKEGKCVGRLKGGDPAIFGRVWEEGSFLAENGIEVSCVSGISSSLGGALSGGIIPTLRGISSGVVIVSAHLRESVFHTEWLYWLKNSSYTLVVMMAYSFAERIVESARALGVNLTIPAAFVSKIDSKEQKSVIGTFGELVQMAALCEKPAVLIIGEAVRASLTMPYKGERIVLASLESNKQEIAYKQGESLQGTLQEFLAESSVFAECTACVSQEAQGERLESPHTLKEQSNEDSNIFQTKVNVAIVDKRKQDECKAIALV